MPLRSQNLRDTNRRLLHWFNSMVDASGRTAVATPEQMSAMLSELLRVGEGLRGKPLPGHDDLQNDDPELEIELNRYRRNVERLRELLPAIHRELLAERARLEVQRARVRAAAEWARASRQTL
jgi:hypothetical protein